MGQQDKVQSSSLQHTVTDTSHVEEVVVSMIYDSMISMMIWMTTKISL